MISTLRSAAALLAGATNTGDVWGGKRLQLPVPSSTLLRRLFDLTPAEARLAQALSRGESLTRIAQALGIKMPTVRSQLAAIFGKTRTTRQPQLVALLARLAHLEDFHSMNPPPRRGAVIE